MRLIKEIYLNFDFLKPYMNQPLNNISNNPADHENLLRAHGVYPTAQRMAIAKILFSRHQHITADQLHTLLKQKGFLVSKATVYNTLALFVQNNLLFEIFIDPNSVYYDSNISHHHHFYNVDTGELIDIAEDLAPRFDTAKLPEGTFFDDVDIVIRVRNQNPQ
jgi:Fur family transcriptional regulator, iron response regulator